MVAVVFTMSQPLRRPGNSSQCKVLGPASGLKGSVPGAFAVSGKQTGHCHSVFACACG